MHDLLASLAPVGLAAEALNLNRWDASANSDRFVLPRSLRGRPPSKSTTLLNASPTLVLQLLPYLLQSGTVYFHMHYHFDRSTFTTIFVDEAKYLEVCCQPGMTGSQLDEEIRLVLRKRAVQAEGLFRREAVVDVAQVLALLC